MNTWGVIKQLCSGKLVASTAVWIFIVPAIVKISQVIEVKSVINGVELVAPHSLIYLYFSAVSFFISNILYIVACPNLIKEVRNYNAFCSLGYTVFDLSNSTENVKEATAKKLIYKIKKEVESATPDEIDSSEHQTQTLTIGLKNEPQAFTFKVNDLPVVFNLVYNFNLGRLYGMQLLCWMFLSIGLGLLAFLLINNLFVVASEINFT